MIQSISEISANEMTIIDINSDFYGVSRYNLMKNAGEGIASFIKDKFYAEFKNKIKIAIFCSSGGNAGDGFVAARKLQEFCVIDVYTIGNESKIRSKNALKNYLFLKEEKVVNLIDITGIINLSQIKLISYDIIIDALLGTGLNSKILRDPIKSIIKLINDSNHKMIISVDMPSGLMNDGNAADFIIKPHHTIALHRAKLGTKEHGGIVSVLDIGIPLDTKNYVGPGIFINWSERQRNTHKGQNGKLLIIGGSYTFHGAPILAAKAALSLTIDLVTLFVPEIISTAVRSHDVRYIVRTYDNKFLTISDLKRGIIPILDDFDVVLIGPGLGAEKETIEAVKFLINDFGKKKQFIIDADALKACKGIVLPDQCILTPHSGEFKVITGQSLSHFSLEPEKKLNFLNQSIKTFNSHIVWVLKGPIDIITQNEKYFFNKTGIPEMSVGGTGDVLAGLISGIRCIVKDSITASAMGTFLIGMASELMIRQRKWFDINLIFEFIPKTLIEIKKFIKEEENNLLI